MHMWLKRDPNHAKFLALAIFIKNFAFLFPNLLNRMRNTGKLYHKIKYSNTKKASVKLNII